MARSVFFSFHYQRDIFRVNQIKNHYVTKGNNSAAGYFDGSLEEKAQKEGDFAVKKLIDNGLNGSSVLCVLIGKETYLRRWVHYEIFKSIEAGMGVFGVKIHQVKDPNTGSDTAGENPFEYLGYGRNDSFRFVPKIKYQNGWQDATYLEPMRHASAEYLVNTDRPLLSNLFKVYDWQNDRGYDNFGSWVEAAALQAGR